jgi:hypothetical protein
VVLVAAATPLGVLAHQEGNLVAAGLMIPFGAVGVLVAHRQPRNSIGWVLVALTLVVLLGSIASFYSVMAYRLGYRSLPLARLAVALALPWVPVLTLLPFPILLFPDGRIPGGRWRWTFWGLLALAAALAVSLGITDLGAFTDRTVTVSSNGSLAAINAPTHGSAAALNDAFLVAYVAIFVAVVLRQLLRFRRATGDERQQLKWLLSGGAVAVICLVVASQVSNSSPVSAAFLGIAALPLSIGLGILRYRLYEIDRLISRTLSYALLTAALAGVFVGLVVLMTDVLPFSSPVGVATSTLGAAALFTPLRRRTQRLIDRRFNRARYDAQATVAAFAGRLRNAVDLDSISGELLHVVDRTVAPVQASLWVRPSTAAPLEPR